MCGDILGGKLDDIDVEILRNLQKDCRISIRELARRLKVSPGTIHNRLVKLVREGVIRGFTPIIDYSKLGIPITALILASVEGKHLIDFEREVARDNRVISVYDITGDFDVALICKFKSISDLDKFIKNLLRIPYVKRTVTSIALNVVKEDPRVGF